MGRIGASMDWTNASPVTGAGANPVVVVVQLVRAAMPRPVPVARKSLRFMISSMRKRSRRRLLSSAFQGSRRDPQTKESPSGMHADSAILT
jgi:hypothetical protein